MDAARFISHYADAMYPLPQLGIKKETRGLLDIGFPSSILCTPAAAADANTPLQSLPSVWGLWQLLGIVEGCCRVALLD